MAISIVALTSLNFDQQIMAFAVHSTLWPWKSSCKILCYTQVYKIFVFTIVLISYYFSKRGSEWVGGIENIYHDPCQDELDLINMKLTSPNYNVENKTYDPLEDCTWNITAPPGHFVTLDFEEIGVSNLELREILLCSMPNLNLCSFLKPFHH